MLTASELTNGQRIAIVRRILADYKNGYSYAGACEKQGIAYQTFYLWKRKFLNANGSLKMIGDREKGTETKPIDLDEEKKQLQDEVDAQRQLNSDLRAEIEILKEAIRQSQENVCQLEDVLYDIMTDKFDPHTDDVRGIVAKSVIEEWTKAKKAD